MARKLGVIMDPIQSIKYDKDSTIAMLNAASLRGWELFYMEQCCLYQTQDHVYGNMRALTVQKKPDHWFSLGPYQTKRLSHLDVILMRKDPPFDMEYIYSTYLLEQAESEGTFVINSPSSIRDCNEKQFITQFPKFIPPLLISRSHKQISAFSQKHKQIVIKPLDGMGASSVFCTNENDPNLNVIIETLTQNGTRQVMAQKFIPDVSIGDKRIILIDGIPIPYALLRIAAHGDFRCNLAAGGQGKHVPLTPNDYRIVETVSPIVKKRNLIFVGLDVIGNYLTEINVTSPTGIREIENQSGVNVADIFIAAIEKRIENKIL